MSQEKRKEIARKGGESSHGGGRTRNSGGNQSARQRGFTAESDHGQNTIERDGEGRFESNHPSRERDDEQIDIQGRGEIQGEEKEEG